MSSSLHDQRKQSSVAASGMEGLIEIMNELHSVFAAVNSAPISLPQLVVVGSQSSGKSSVIEHIVGRDFLPRGTGICTRRPLVLQLINVPANDADDAKSSSTTTSSSLEYGEFSHRPNQRFFDFEKIRAEIVADTDKITLAEGMGSKGISKTPIYLTIYSPRVLTLTLVDLPGITKVPIADQPQDIEQQIEELILSFITSPHALIVAVSAANVDLANSDSLKLARKVDPDGRRTIGVLTKVDLIDLGAVGETLKVISKPELMNIQIQHGFYGVVCRGQQAINTKQSIAQALRDEEQFFSRDTYRQHQQRLGTANLAKKLQAILMAHIQSSIPEVRNKIQATISETSEELTMYGEGSDTGRDEGAILLPILSAYCQHFAGALDGRTPELSTAELYGGARLSYIFREIFGSYIESISPLDYLSDHDIRISIRNASGSRPSLFIPEISFELLVKQQIQRLLQPSLDCVELVSHEILRLAEQCLSLIPELVRYPVLRERMVRVFYATLESCLAPTKAHIESLIRCELAFINTNHPSFIGGSRAVQVVMERINAKTKNGTATAVNASPSLSATVDPTDSKSKHHSASANPSQYQTSSYYGVPASTSSSTSTTSSSTSSSQRTPGTHHNASLSSPPISKGHTPQQRSGFFSNFFGSPSPTALSTQQPSNGKITRTNTTSAAANTSKPGASTTSTSGTTSGSSIVEHDMYVDPHHISGSSSASGLTNGLNVSATAGGSNSYPAPHFLEANDREVIETEVIKVLMQSYFHIVRTTITDQIPKCIMHFLVGRLKSEFQSLLVRELYQTQLLPELLKEDEEINGKRIACRELLAILHRAIDILDQTKHMHF